MVGRMSSPTSQLTLFCKAAILVLFCSNSGGCTHEKVGFEQKWLSSSLDEKRSSLDCAFRGIGTPIDLQLLSDSERKQILNLKLVSPQYIVDYAFVDQIVDRKKMTIERKSTSLDSLELIATMKYELVDEQIEYVVDEILKSKQEFGKIPEYVVLSSRFFAIGESHERNGDRSN
jgi:hypothetical protein